MRICSVEAIAIRIPLKKTFGGSQYRVDSRCTIITRIGTDQGLVSEVYNGDNRTRSKELVEIINKELCPLLLGEDVFSIERIWEKCFLLSYSLRDRKLVMEAIACIDTGIWDLIGKALNINVCRLLGGYRKSLPVIAIAGYYEKDKTLNDLRREMDWLNHQGMAGCKVKVGGLSPEDDAKRVAAARDGGGPEFILALDANQGWSVKDAIRFAGLVEHLDIRWFEEPCHWYDDINSMARVRAATSIPINAGQSEVTRYGIHRLLSAGAVDSVNFDASEGGGITEWRRAAAICSVYGVQMSHHEEPQISSQLLAAVPHGTYVECFPDPERDPIWAHMILNRPTIKDGVMDVPQGSGFGLELDWKMIEKYRLN
jgi:D-arabinonate dehydratase